MTLSAILLVLALICFVLGAARVSAAIDWTNAGFAFVTASVLAGAVVIA